MSCNADIKPIADARRRPVAWLALGLLGASIAGCSAAAGISGEQVPCSSSSQCYGGEVCFLGECRGGSFALASVLAEVRPPSGTAYGVQQVGAIDLRQSVVVNFALSPALGVSGSVLQLLGAQPADGTSPVSDAQITFSARNQPIPGRAQEVSVQATAGGLFSAQLPVGTWDATVLPPTPLPPLYDALALAASSSTVQLLLPAASTLLPVQGQLTAGGTPLAGARVLAVDSTDRLLGAAASADATGTFQLLLPPGAPSFLLRVGPALDDTSAGGAAATRLPNYAPVGPFAAASGQISYDFGAPPPAVALSGSVVDSSGNPVVGARVYALSLDGQGYVLSSSTQSGASGAFQLQLLAGMFAVEAAPMSAAGAPALSAETDLQLAAPGQSIQLVCPPQVQASGRLLLPNGMPAPQGTQLSATRLPDRLVSSRVAQTQPTDAQGNYSIVADPGTYRIAITPPPSSNLAGTVVEMDIEPASPGLPDVALPPTLQVVGTISGQSAQGTTAPLAGATVQFFALDSTGQSAISLGTGLTDSSGRYVALLPDVEQPGIVAQRR